MKKYASTPAILIKPSVAPPAAAPSAAGNGIIFDANRMTIKVRGKSISNTVISQRQLEWY
jgi:hypothetical protein